MLLQLAEHVVHLWHNMQQYVRVVTYNTSQDITQGHYEATISHTYACNDVCPRSDLYMPDVKLSKSCSS